MCLEDSKSYKCTTHFSGIGAPECAARVPGFKSSKEKKPSVLARGGVKTPILELRHLLAPFVSKET